MAVGSHLSSAIVYNDRPLACSIQYSGLLPLTECLSANSKWCTVRIGTWYMRCSSEPDGTSFQTPGASSSITTAIAYFIVTMDKIHHCHKDSGVRCSLSLSIAPRFDAKCPSCSARFRSVSGKIDDGTGPVCRTVELNSFDCSSSAG